MSSLRAVQGIWLAEFVKKWLSLHSVCVVVCSCDQRHSESIAIRVSAYLPEKITARREGDPS